MLNDALACLSQHRDRTLIETANLAGIEHRRRSHSQRPGSSVLTQKY
jgi:hypothetical protein